MSLVQLDQDLELFSPGSRIRAGDGRVFVVADVRFVSEGGEAGDDAIEDWQVFDGEEWHWWTDTEPEDQPGFWQSTGAAL